MNPTPPTLLGDGVIRMVSLSQDILLIHALGIGVIRMVSLSQNKLLIHAL